LNFTAAHDGVVGEVFQIYSGFLQKTEVILRLPKLFYAMLLLVIAHPAWGNSQPHCDPAANSQVCILSYGRVTIRIESDDANTVRRFILYTDDRMGEADRLTAAVGRLMIMIKPASTPDERADFIKNDGVERWGGFYWKTSFAQPGAARIIAERE
jgi:hypothetical protein